MRHLVLALVVAMPIGCPAIASADLIWADPAWSVTPTVSGQFPPYATGSAGYSDPAGDGLTGFLSAFAENPPGPGGPSVVARLEISRSFLVVGVFPHTDSVALLLSISGALSVGPVGGATDANLTVQFEVLGRDDISIFRTYDASVLISETATDLGSFEAGGTYTVRGNVELRAFAFSGGPSASGDVRVGVSLSPTPRAVPEPGGATLLASGVVGWLGFGWRRRRNWRRGGSGVEKGVGTESRTFSPGAAANAATGRVSRLDYDISCHPTH
jgi:hypothetical protein